MSLRSALIRLASANPALRPHLLPLLKRADKHLVPSSSLREAKSTSIRPEAKDHKRISDMVNKARDDAHLLQLAGNMANAITDGPKAMRRARAAEAINYHDVAAIFFRRAQQLGY